MKEHGINFDFSLEKLHATANKHNVSYFEKMVKQISERIEKCVIAEKDSMWVTFIWEDGNESPVIKFFEDRGITFGSPTGPWEGGSTSWLLSWKI